MFKVVIAALILSTSTICAAQSQKDEFYRNLNSIRRSRLKCNIIADTVLEKEASEYLDRMLRIYNGKLVHDKFTTRYEVITSCDNALNCWIDSKPHRKILLSRKVKKIGVAFIDGYALARLK